MSSSGSSSYHHRSSASGRILLRKLIASDSTDPVTVTNATNVDVDVDGIVDMCWSDLVDVKLVKRSVPRTAIASSCPVTLPVSKPNQISEDSNINNVTASIDDVDNVDCDGADYADDDIFSFFAEECKMKRQIIDSTIAPMI